ncbi:carboxylesterase/lipase family protein [Gordonia soli]|nr:carboxylesterase family protein [Gordonia soli]
MIVRRTIPILSVALALALSVVTGCAASDSAPQPAPLETSTSSGQLRGVDTATTREYRGVRYAEPPVGDRRWTLPVAAGRAPGIVDASRAGSPCPQTTPLPGGQPQPSEDCLSVNVTTPLHPRRPGPLPVMVWWHGGGYTSGSGASYDARRLAERGDVVVVTVNYRLGVFGYLGLPGLPGGGDFGLADQLQSLRWVRDNATAFGADPENVTVVGESAGGMSACAALTTPASDGLVDKAVIASGSCLLDWPKGGLYPGVDAQTPYTAREQSERLGASVAEGLGCSGAEAISCLRRLPEERLMSVDAQFSNVLAYGTDLLPDDPAAVFRKGGQAPVPMIAGGNRDEHRSFIGGYLAIDPTAITDRTYPTLVADAFGDRAPAVLDRYPLVHFPSPAIAWSTVITDAAWACPTVSGARLSAARAPTWLYEFADESAPNINQVTTIPQGAAHATDTPYYFDLGGNDLLRTPRQRQIGDQMIDFWTSFAHDGTARITGGPDVRQMSTTDRTGLRFGTETTEYADLFAEHSCDLWNR